MSDRYQPQDPNTQLYFRFRKFQEWSPTIAVLVSCFALALVGYQSCQMDKQLKSMNDALVQQKREADAAQASAAIASQLIVGIVPPTVRPLAPGKPMIVDFSFTNRSNFVASITGWIVNFQFVKVDKLKMIPADGWIGGVDLPSFDLEPQWSGNIGTVRSRILSQSEVNAIRDDKVRAYVFLRVFIKGAAKPLDGCYTYYREDKNLKNCVITNSS
jgi:hypothetical protein